MKLAASAATKELDRKAIEERHVSSTWLMENAAGHVARAAMAYMDPCGCAAIFCGSGNNGGDGVAAALHLKSRGYACRVFLVGSAERMTADTAEMCRRYREIGGEVETFSPDAAGWCAKADVCIDAMFGTGLRRPLDGAARQAAELMNSLPVPVVAADIASGLSADSGEAIGGLAVKADVTVTFSFAKPGHYSGAGAYFSGNVQICDIGIPEDLIWSFETDCFSVTADDLKGSIPKRKWDAHKGDFGKILIVGGSRGLTGAPELAAKAALRAGAGLVWLGVPEGIYAIEAGKNTEAMPFPLPEDAEGRLAKNALTQVLQKLNGCGLCLVGPGLGRSAEICAFVEELILNAKVPLILDADGINAVSGNIDILKKAKVPILLTPHEGEFSRLSDSLSRKDRISAAREFAAEYGVTLILKGPGTLTALPDGRVFVNTSGGPALAKGGSGDVLAGMSAAFLAQGLAPWQAVYLHGRAADLYSARFDEYSMLASDIIGLLPEVFKETL